MANGATNIFNGTLVLSNETSTSSSLKCFVNDSTVKRIFHVTAYLVIFIISLLGNTMTVLIVKRGPARRNCAHIFLANMAMSDLVITIVYMPRMVVRMFYGSQWLFDGIVGTISCRVVVFVHHSAILVAIISVFLITLDRFLAIMFPLKRIMTKQLCVGLIVCTWIIAGALRSPFLISCMVKPSKTYTLVCLSNFNNFFGEFVSVYRNTIFGIFWVFLISTIIFYIIIVSHLCLKKSPGNTMEATTSRQKAGCKLLKMMICITAAFVICWILYFLAIIIYGSDDLPCDLYFMRFFLAHLNCAINPCLLALFDGTYRKSYKNILKKTFCLSNKVTDDGNSNPSVLEVRQTPLTTTMKRLATVEFLDVMK